ncbi:nucleotide exchange factor GrpE [Nitrospira sp. Kam-Ns4a]
MSENEGIPNTFSELQGDTPTSQDSAREEPSQTGSVGDGGSPLAGQNEELERLQDKYLRLAAEFENYKKLVQRDQREQARFAAEGILRELLPVVDNLERAVSCAKQGQAIEGLIQGVELTLKQFHETLNKFGVRPVEGLGAPFDPACQQAVARLESGSAPENTVIEVYQKGYFLHDRLLRAAMVAVAAAPAETGGDAPAASPSENALN